MQKLKIADVVISLSVIVGIGVTLIPAAARMQRTPSEAMCQANLHMWAEAVALYTADNNGRYPSNRIRSGAGFSSTPVNEVRLSSGDLDGDGRPIFFQYGINWVEGLYPYLEQAAEKTDRNRYAFMKCPNAANTSFPPSSPTAGVSYAFNGFLVEYFPALVHNPSKVMMMREMDRMVNSVLRPIYTSSQTTRPTGAFLTTTDRPYGSATNNKLHGDGSYIVFADGHVSYFTTDYFVDDSMLQRDYQTNQWYNYYYANPVTDRQKMLNKSIAITP